MRLLQDVFNRFIEDVRLRFAPSFQQLCIAFDDGQWCLHLMRDIGHELPLLFHRLIDTPNHLIEDMTEATDLIIAFGLHGLKRSRRRDPLHRIIQLSERAECLIRNPEATDERDDDSDDQHDGEGQDECRDRIIDALIFEQIGLILIDDTEPIARLEWLIRTWNTG